MGLVRYLVGNSGESVQSMHCTCAVVHVTGGLSYVKHVSAYEYLV